MPGEDFCTDKVLSKTRILQELTNAVKIVYAQSLHGSVVLDGDSWLVYWLDRALRHGLRVERHGYWGTARELSHQDTVVVIHALQNVLTSIGKGRAWLYHTLSEGSFESYLACLLRDQKTLQKQYFPHALLRDIDKTNQLINLIAGLENVSFTLQLDVTYLDICNYMPRRPMSGSPPGTALTLRLKCAGISPSLVSLGDSGVALDSDMDFINDTDASSYQEEFCLDELTKYQNKYSKLSKDDSLERSTSSDSSEDGKIHDSDIVNQNVNNCKLDNKELQSVDTKDYCYYDKNLDDRQLDRSNNYLDGGYCFKKNIVDPRNSYVINNDTNLLELSMTISDCDNTYEAPYSILNTIHMSDTSILSTSCSESVVHRRQRKKKRGENKKRVSFHEDIFKTMKLEDDESPTDFSLSFLQPGGRNSWCANSEVRPSNVNSRHVRSDCYLQSMSFPETEDDDRVREEEISFFLAERGVPEGQEDPATKFRPKIEIELQENEAQEAYIVEKQFGNVVEDPPVKLEMPRPTNLRGYTSQSDWSDLDSVMTVSDVDDQKSYSGRHLSSPVRKRSVTSVLSPEGKLSQPLGRQSASKSSLLNRFLRSITEKKFEKKSKKKSTKPSPLYIKGAVVDASKFKDFNDLLEKEMNENGNVDEWSDEKIGSDLYDLFKRTIFRDKNEILYKVYKVSSSYMTNGESKPMLALLTNNTLYLTGMKANYKYSNQFVIPYTELDVIMVGPNAQTMLISNADYEMQYLVQTGSAQVTSELIAHLEIAMRRSKSKPKLPSVRQLNYDDMHALKRSILSETAVHPDEKIEFYSVIKIEDEHMSPPGSPCGPSKEGDLMFRPHVYQPLHPNAPTNPWEAGYFVLKGGVIYMFTDSNQRLPKRAIPLREGLCMGCRRIPNSHRPHTFEILLKPNKSYQFAAPDEYVASEWLQSFVQSASGLFDCTEKREPSSCSLVVTTKHIIAIKEVYPASQRTQTLCCASIDDLTALRVPSPQQSWCILEFACREVHENSGDWVVYFNSPDELDSFQKILEDLWDEDKKEQEFPLTTTFSNDKIVCRCTEACKDMKNAWQHLIPAE